MIRIDGYYLYRIGASLRPLSRLDKDTSFANAELPLLVAQGELETLLDQSVFKLKVAYSGGRALLDNIKRAVAAMEAVKAENKMETTIGLLNAYFISDSLSKFETLLAAELGLSPLFLVAKKRGYDTADLIDNGTVLFPDELLLKVPETLLDISQGARCLAFELPTAAAFHFHRANESVLHRYFDAVTSGAPRPNGNNIGAYLNEMDRLQVGDPVVRAALKDLKDLHRNPLIHPQQTLESVDEAISLLGSIQSVIVHMLKVIPFPPSS